MSVSCDTDSGNEHSRTSKYEISMNLKEQLKDFPQALKFIELLEKKIKRQKRKFKRLKSKFKTISKRHDMAVQTEEISNNSEIQSITEQITEAAQLATQKSGFVYDESSGLYYDSISGYYYNAEYGLYYDSNTGTYLSYKQDTNTYEFHSQVYVPKLQGNPGSQARTKRKNKCKDEEKAPKCIRLERDSPLPTDTEEGECSVTSCSELSDDSKSDNSELSKKWPPCMRIIIEQSSSPKIKVGSLHILTYEGGTLGREGDHAVLLPDINISKCHLKFTYDKIQKSYFVIDLGSRNGTILNGKRMSTAKQESDAFEVPHGSRIQIGTVVLVCHVHDGYTTCGLCEPGLIQSSEKKVVTAKSSKNEQHKHELKKLRKKFGVCPFEENSIKLASGYTDRAQKRRETVGSQNAHEKTEVASLEESIPSQNKGFKMLAKMGWKEGQSLGKDSQGMLEPIPIAGNVGTTGVGNNETTIPKVNIDRSKQIIWQKTKERFNKLPANVFEDSA